MYKAILFGIVIIILSKSELQAKSDFRDGFIITANKDTIFGKIDYRSNNGKSCIFKSGSGTREYYPEQILGYGFINDRYFTSQVIEGTFAEVLVQGELSLYKNGYDFFIQKSGYEVFRLESKQVKDTVEFRNYGESADLVGYREDVRWKGTLSFLTSDCVESYQTIQSMTLGEKDMRHFAVEYNLCKGASFHNFKAIKPRFKIDYGISAGLVYSILKFKNIPSQFSFLTETFKSYNPSAGLIFAVSSPRISERLALQTELYYIRTSYYSQIVVDQAPGTGYYETYIDFTTLSVPLSVKYTLPFGNSSLFFNAGVDFAFLTDNNSKVNMEMLSGNVVNTYVNEPFEYNNNPMGYWGDIGYLKAFKSFRIGATLKYYQTGNLNTNEEITSSLNRISLSLILLGK